MDGSKRNPAPESLLGKPGKKINVRAFILFTACTFVAALLLGRLFYLQIFKYNEYRRKVIEQMVYETEITAPRGNITDRNGIVLATNKITERVFISPYDMKDDTEREFVSRNLSEILNVDYETILAKTKKYNRKDETVKRYVDETTADKVRQFIIDNDLSCIHMVEMTSRLYPFGSLASHVIGFCGTDGGLTGLEYTYNKALSGTSGKIIAAENASGGSMPYNYETYIDAENGANIVTTIDYKIQSFLEKYLEQAAVESGCESRATGIVMNPQNGEIYALAVYPYFDLNSPFSLPGYYYDDVAGIAAKYVENSTEYDKAILNLCMSMWNNKAITETYEPGSTSKIFTTSMALEEKVAKVTDMFSCSGSSVISGWTIHCHKRAGHGSLNFEQGLQHSCNPVMMRLAERIGISAFCKYFAAFGLTKKTGIDLPGETSSVYTPENKMTILDLAVYSFGQRFNVSAIQQITAVAAVANGGTLVTPHVVRQIKDDKGDVIASFDTNTVRQVVSKETASEISRILAEGVAGTGGAANAYVAGYSVAAKTGTSEKGTGSSARIASTVAYAPSYDPQVVCIIIVDEPTTGVIYGSTIAAPYVGKVIEDTLEYLGVPRVYTEKEKQSVPIEVPNLRGSSLDAATASLKAVKLSYKVIGNGTSVVRQLPEAGGTVSPENGSVILYTELSEAQTATVPDVKGKTAEQANEILTDAGFNISVSGATGSGEATVYTQSAQPGTQLPVGTVITVDFRFTDSDG